MKSLASAESNLSLHHRKLVSNRKSSDGTHMKRERLRINTATELSHRDRRTIKLSGKDTKVDLD